jgi:hypothetical protein
MPDVVSPSGEVIRPAGDEDVDVTLTATVTYQGASTQVAVVVTVRRYVDVTPAHPQIYVSDDERDELVAKLAEAEWAGESFENMQARIDPLADRHQNDPEWITSRMSMYWAEGERYTQVYVQNQNFGWGEGDAPVPTVRMPGMRIWNDNRNAPLDDRIPYSEDGSMVNQHGEVVPYLETGHMIRGNNQEILDLAQQSAFLHWMTDDEKYAAFAADIYWQWVLGVYYMQPPLDPGESLGGPGGWEPGGIGGYYAYEVIHDIMGGQAAVIYDFLYDYLKENPDPHAVEIGKDVAEISDEVFRRFIEIGMVRGHATGNWNTNRWGSILPAILALETNDYYPDGKGREYYLHYYTTQSGEHHTAVPDILNEYDPVTGLWPEAPGYAFGTISTLLDFAIPVYRAGFDTIADNDVMQRAALAVVPWLDARGNLVVFGNMRGGPPNHSMFERLLTYFRWTGDDENAELMSGILDAVVEVGSHRRDRFGIADLAFGVETSTVDGVPDDTRAAYSPFHRHVTLKNKSDSESGLMAALYGGYPNQHHLNPNGLALQLYGMGYALAPDAKAYESYWSDDHAYHAGPASANTIVPGYAHGPITINALEPAVPDDSFTNVEAMSDYVSFSDVSAAEKRRQVGIVRTSTNTGYYVDIFRSDQDDNDYLHHNLGTELVVADAAGEPLGLAPSDDLQDGRPSEYRFFDNQHSVEHNDDFGARWIIDTVEPHVVMEMWMSGQDGRTIYQVDAPPSTVNSRLSPGGANVAPETTPTLVVRQQGANAADAPFAAVFEPYHAGEKSIESITDYYSDGAFVGLEVSSSGDGELDGRLERILSSSDDSLHEPEEGVEFSGLFGVASQNSDGFQYLYLGMGTRLAHDVYALTSSDGEEISAALTQVDGGLTYSASDDVTLTVPSHADAPSDVQLQYFDGVTWQGVASTIDGDANTVTGTVPAGYDVPVRVVQESSASPSVSVHPGIVSNQQLSTEGVTVTATGLTPGNTVTVTVTDPSGRSVDVSGDATVEVNSAGKVTYQLVTT